MAIYYFRHFERLDITDNGHFFVDQKVVDIFVVDLFVFRHFALDIFTEHPVKECYGSRIIKNVAVKIIDFFFFKFDVILGNGSVK